MKYSDDASDWLIPTISNTSLEVARSLGLAVLAVALSRKKTFEPACPYSLFLGRLAVVMKTGYRTGVLLKERILKAGQ